MIKFVYFDLGGVTICDFSGTNKWQEMKKIMGVKEDFDKEFDQLYDQYEKNDCPTVHVDTLIPTLSKKFDMHFSPEFSLQKYFVEHFEKNLSLWPIIDKFQQSCKVGLLTNMYPGLFNSIRDHHLLPPTKWDLIIDSTIVLLQKPDPKIYKLAEEKCGFRGDEILFIDDRQKNIDTAKLFGWQTFLYDPANPQESSRELLQFWKTRS